MSDYDDDLNLIRQAQREERYEQAHELLIEYLESASNLRDGERLANGLLAFAENLLHCCPELDDPFEGRKEAAQAALGIFEELGDKRGITNALLILDSVDMGFDGRLAREALAVARREKGGGSRKGVLSFRLPTPFLRPTIWTCCHKDSVSYHLGAIAGVMSQRNV